jgi:hypothetical protein
MEHKCSPSNSHFDLAYVIAVSAVSMALLPIVILMDMLWWESLAMTAAAVNLAVLGVKVARSVQK